MMRFDYRNWARVADRVRGTEKPEFLSADGWKKWHSDAKKKHPFRYWVVETGVSYLEKMFMWPLDRLYSAKYYVVNRWVDQSHALVAHSKHIKPGNWMDLDNRILYCLFDELVDFVEIEKAHKNFLWDSDKHKDMKWWQVGRWRTRTWRCAEAGIDYLKWEMTLTNEECIDNKELAVPTAQAKSAREIMELYDWWTNVYPNRPDAYDVSGWTKYCENKRERGIGFMETDPLENREETNKILERNSEIENEYNKEDEEMLIRLVKLRGSLWT